MYEKHSTSYLLNKWWVGKKTKNIWCFYRKPTFFTCCFESVTTELQRLSNKLSEKIEKQRFSIWTPNILNIVIQQWTRNIAWTTRTNSFWKWVYKTTKYKSCLQKIFMPQTMPLVPTKVSITCQQQGFSIY